MQNIIAPVAISGLRAADKIRSVIYANHQLAHVPLAEILKLAVQTGQGDSYSRNGQQEKDKGGVLPDRDGHFIRLSETLLIQYGFQAYGKSSNVKEENTALTVHFPLGFASADYYPYICAYAVPGDNFSPAFIAAECLEKTGFTVRFAPLVSPKADSKDKAETMPRARPGGVFWLAIGFAA